MKAIEISRNGEKLFTAGLEDGIVTARMIVRNQVDPIWFDVDGRDASTGGHRRWVHATVQVDDEWTMKIVEIAEVDAET